MIAAAFVLVTWLLFVFYAAVMSLKRARDDGRMSWSMKAMALPALYIGLLLDIAVNVTVCTVLFLELPRELLVTSRLTRHAQGAGWRSAIARWICVNLLDALDPSGCHCK